MKKKISFLSLCFVCSLLVAFLFLSCKGQQGGVGEQREKFDIVGLKLWGKDILGVDEIAINGKDVPKAVSVVVTNCDEYNVEVSMCGKKGHGTASDSSATVLFDDITSDEVLEIKLFASGMKTETIKVKVELEETSTDDVEVLFGNTRIPENVPYSTIKATETITVKTIDSKLHKVIIDGKDAKLSADEKSATYNLAITGTETNPQTVSINIEFKHFNPLTKTYKVRKFASEQDLPLELISAKILSGDDEKKINILKFDDNKKTTLTLKDIRYSTVKLVMEFDQNLTNRVVKRCKDQRTNKYSTSCSVGAENAVSFSGTFSGYITHDVSDEGRETALTQIDGRTYTEVLIAGYGTVSYEIEVVAGNGKTETYIIEIVNPAKTVNGDLINIDHFMKNVMAYNGNTGHSIFFPLRGLNGFFLPYYYKGPNYGYDGISENGFTDLAYMEGFSLVLYQVKTEEPFYFYYNVMEDEGGNPNDKHEFKRIKAVKWSPDDDGNAQVVAIVRISDLNNKYLDAFMSGKYTLPNPMVWSLYGKKWRRASNRHGWLLRLDNKKQCKMDGEKIPATEIFDFIFNYRVQTISYDEQNKNGGQNKYLTIAKNQKFKFWETGADTVPGWVPFLSGEEGENKDKFKFEALCNSEAIKEVKYTIKKGDDEASCVQEAGYENVVLQANKDKNDRVYYKLGCKAGETESSYTFKDKVYKIEIEVTYKENEAKKDNFRYLLDYTNTKHTLELMNIADETNESSNLFGLPSTYDFKILNPDIIKKIAM